MNDEQQKYFNRGFAAGVVAMAVVATLMVVALIWAAA